MYAIEANGLKEGAVRLFRDGLRSSEARRVMWEAVEDRLDRKEEEARAFVRDVGGQDVVWDMFWKAGDVDEPLSSTMEASIRTYLFPRPAHGVVPGISPVKTIPTTKTYRLNEFRSVRPTPGGMAFVGGSSLVGKLNASRAPSRHVDEFETK